MDSEHEAQDELVEIAGSRYRVHPAAAVFPIMSGREFDELVEGRARQRPARAGGGQRRPADRRAEPGPGRARPPVSSRRSASWRAGPTWRRG